MTARGMTARPGSRCGSLSSEIDNGTARTDSDPAAVAAGGKAAPKMRQAQLPLAIITKGRFDKSEPTIHQGEDLDIPTYIRRGVALN